MTPNNSELVWYASYGSNLLEERFLCYIRGGKASGSNKVNPGCRDKTLPRNSEEIYIASEMYFARHSSGWGGGMAFIKTEFDKGLQTYGRMYLITKEQFVDVVKQEINFDGELNIDFNRAINDGSYVFKERSLYGNIIHIGNQYEHPIFTFTNESNFLTTTKPSLSYLTAIANGIAEIFPNISQQEILEYIKVKDGVRQNYANLKIEDLFSNLSPVEPNSP